ncbi:MAG: hypothetical protein GWN40_00040, partial [Nitrosopumilaceae archaeon]|nr:hypothetical protein [Nitrosopumilaceae archaeon]
MGEIIDKFQLNLSVTTPELLKENLFDSVQVSSKSEPGTYELEQTGGRYNLYYTDQDVSVEDRLLLSFLPNDTVRVNNIVFNLNHDYISSHKHEQLSFKIREYTRAIENLRQRISHGFDRSGSMMSIVVTSKSRSYAAKIANTVAEKLIDLNLKMRRHKSQEVLKILENELQIAKAGLDEANEKLKNFQKKYPWISLTSGLEAVNQLEEQKTQTLTKRKDIQELINKVRSAADFGKKLVAIKELLTYLAQEKLVLLPAYQSEFTTLMEERNNLLSNYASTHPLVVENREAIDVLTNKIINLAQEHLAQLEEHADKYGKEIASENYKLRNLPQKQLELAELTSEQRIKRQLYENILSRYNAVKIDKEIEVSEMFVLDPAAVPLEAESSFQEKARIAIIGLILAIGMAIGLA